MPSTRDHSLFFFVVVVVVIIVAVVVVVVVVLLLLLLIIIIIIISFLLFAQPFCHVFKSFSRLKILKKRILCLRCTEEEEKLHPG